MIYNDIEDGLHSVMFPVRKVKVFAETEPGKRDLIPGKKALINDDTCRVLSVVSDKYQVLHNRRALELARKCCIAAFPNTAPAKWEVFGVEAPKTPRMRGNRCSRRYVGVHRGSIPAHAGEPGEVAAVCVGHRVYPRACGGTRGGDDLIPPCLGLSPRMRGNLWANSSTTSSPGSIPAHAGEPGCTFWWGPSAGVYPRACGGTLSGAHKSRSRKGLSPRMRGNPSIWSAVSRGGRSIPAHAGEPPGRCKPAPRDRVYPRACGGTL